MPYDPVGQQAMCEAKQSSISLSLIDNLKFQREQATKELQRLDELIELVKNNPDTTRILELLGRKGF